MAKPNTIEEHNYIYSLSCPDTGEVRYIGKARNIKKRLCSHLADSKRKKTPVCCWVHSLVSKGQIPIIKEICVTENWEIDERKIIADFRTKGFKLLNIADGGNQPYCSTEVRASNGRAVAKAIHSDPARKKVWRVKQMVCSDLKRGYYSEGLREKIKKVAMLFPEEYGCFVKYL